MGASFLRDASPGEDRGRANRGENRRVGDQPSGLGGEYTPDERKRKTGQIRLAPPFIWLLEWAPTASCQRGLVLMPLPLK